MDDDTARTDALAQISRRRQRFFVLFGAIELPLIIIVTLLTFVLEVIPEPVGIGILFGIAALGGVILMAGILRLSREQAALG